MSGNGRRSARSRIKSSTDVEEFDRRRNSKPDQKVRKDRIGDHSFIRILNVNFKALLGFLVLAFFIILFLIHHLMKPVEDAQIPRVVTPFPAPKIMDLPQFQGEHKESLYWGTYRPQVYLGIRARESFPDLYAIAVSKDAWVADSWEGGGWSPSFVRSFNDWELEIVVTFFRRLHNFAVVSDTVDSMVRRGNKIGVFSVKSFYSS